MPSLGRGLPLNPRTDSTDRNSSSNTRPETTTNGSLKMATAAQRPNVRYPSQQENPTTANGISRTFSQRRSGQHRGIPEPDYSDGSVLPPAPEVPQGPPVSYRQPVQGQSPLVSSGAKSFSERVRASPRQSLADQGPWSSSYDEATAENGGESRRRPQPGSRQREHEDYAPMSPARAGPPMRQRSVRQPAAQAESAQPRAQPRNLPHINTRNGARVAEQRPTSAKVMSPISRSGSVRDPANMAEDGSSEWAAARSPLQKLELTLNDISKEEKRARVAEAEMLLRESLAAQGSRRISREAHTGGANPPIRRQSQNAGKALSKGLDNDVPRRNVSTSEKDRPDQEIATERRKEDGRRLSARARDPPYDPEPYADSTEHQPRRKSGRVSEDRMPPQKQSGQVPREVYGEEQYVEPPEEPTSRKSRRIAEDATPSPRHPAHEPKVIPQKSAAPYKTSPPTVYDVPTSGVRRSGSTRQSRAEQLEQSIPSNITRAVSSQKKQPLPSFQDDVEAPRSGPIHEANSSHKGALMEGAVAGAATGAAANGVGRSNSRKLQKERPKRAQVQGEHNQSQGLNDQSPSVEYPVEQTAQFYARGAPKQIEIQRSSSKRGGVPVGLGLDRASMDQSDATQNSNQDDRHHLSEMFHRKPRPQSVAFKQPFDRPRPVDEWKNAGVARLLLSDFDLEDADQDKAWWEQSGSGRRRSRRSSEMAKNLDGAADDPRRTMFEPPLFLKCGPLLRYTGMKRDKLEDTRGRTAERETWRGSVMIVTQDAQSSYERGPTLRLFSQPTDLLPPPPTHVDDDNKELAPEYVDPLAGLSSIARTGKFKYVRPIDHIEPEKDLSRLEDDEGLFEKSPSAIVLQDGKTVNLPNKRAKALNGERLGKYKEVQGHRIHADLYRGVTFWRFNLEIELGDHQAHVAYRINNGAPVGFWIPARGQTMNMMFHTCNGFSLSVKPDVFSGPDPLWRDVLNTHQTRPFHVMIGGGDQIYNDKVMIETTHLAQWLKLKNPHDKHHAEFTPEMAEELETFYLDRYSMWFSQGLFGMANSQIPMVNVWDDHDIIDGFGSYPDHFMRTPVFSGLGNIAFKYYMLFQHQSVPEETQQDEPSWLLGPDPGPYIAQRSRNLFMYMGKGVAFLGLDCRTERKVCQN